MAVDLSAKLLEIAQRHEQAQPRGIDYVHTDARTLEGIPGRSFDGVVCSMALMDIANLAPTLRSVARVLRPAGWFVFSILHPCNNTPPSGEMATPLGLARVGHDFPLLVPSADARSTIFDHVMRSSTTT